MEIWTPECILKVGESNFGSGSCGHKPDGGSHNTVIQALHVLSSCVAQAQEKGLQVIVEKSLKQRLRYFITNNMYDETELFFGIPAQQAFLPSMARASHVE